LVNFRPEVTFALMVRLLLNIPFVLDLRRRVGAYMLESEMKEGSRQPQAISLDKAQKIGILFTGEDEQTLNSVSTFVKELRRNGKNVKCLGFVPKPNAVQTLRQSQDMDFFSTDDLNWYFRPQSSLVTSFLSEKFDMLIDLRIVRRVPLPFMVALSKARFKVGRFNEEDKQIFDLMIHADEGMGINEFIDQMRHYLTIFDQNT
jgi:hypothetical protein